MDAITEVSKGISEIDLEKMNKFVFNEKEIIIKLRILSVKLKLRTSSITLFLDRDGVQLRMSGIFLILKM